MPGSRSTRRRAIPESRADCPGAAADGGAGSMRATVVSDRTATNQARFMVVPPCADTPGPRSTPVVYSARDQDVNPILVAEVQVAVVGVALHRQDADRE